MTKDPTVEIEPDNDAIPEWLSGGSSIPIVNQTVTTSVTSKTPSLKLPAQQLEEAQFEASFENILDKIAGGGNLKDILEDDIRQLDHSRMRRWILRDTKRKAKYHEAQEIGAELIADEIIGIADGGNSMEDVQRSKLRIDTRWKLLTVWNRRRYGEVKQVEINQSISISDALNAAHQRMEKALTIEGDYSPVPSMSTLTTLSTDDLVLPSIITDEASYRTFQQDDCLYAED